MPVLSLNEAAERIAKFAEQARPSTLREIYLELFPDRASTTPPPASDLARHIRGGLEAEEIVDLWNVVFPGDRNVRYDEDANAIRYNEEMAGSPD